jgi:hypothetical protein
MHLLRLLKQDSEMKERVKHIWPTRPEYDLLTP